MNIKLYVPLLFLAGCLIVSCEPSMKERTFDQSSPDQKNLLNFYLNEQGEPFYSLSHNNKEVIKPSRLGFEFFNNKALLNNFEVEKVERHQVDTSWNQPWGEFKTIKDNHNELRVTLKEKQDSARIMIVAFKVFNDGLGFRYEFPKQAYLDSVEISDEKTQFTFANNEAVWWMPVHRDNSYYESIYHKNKISETDTINTPATFETKDSLFVAVHEANLTDYASMTLLHTSQNTYETDLVPWANGVKVYAQTPFNTPWRTVMVGETPGDLVTSTLGLNLNEPNQIEDVSWIEPSKYIGIWWGMHLEKYSWGQGPKHGATTENTINYMDFASEHGLDGVLVEGWNVGWDGDWTADGRAFSFTDAYPDFDLEAIAKHAAMKNVRLIGHHETAGAASHYESQLEDAFSLYHRLGVRAVKTGYVNKYLDKKEWHDGQYGVRHYRKVIETAAKYQIMIDNHEPVKGTGLQRTYPNLMTQEGARGQEYNAWSTDGGNPPEHTTILPFTRMLAGPMDFTPGIVDFNYETIPGTKVQTTLAKQLALYVVMFSPLQMTADLPENYNKQPQAFQFIKEVPEIWSETKVLNAQIGSYVTMARKDWNTDNWFVGAITNAESRTLKIDLDFLKEGIYYQAMIYQDGEGANYSTNPYPLEVKKQIVTNKDALNLNLKPGGGTAIKFKPMSLDE
ncbi:glycoside hydrolase family 97 protein [Mangrovimonas sp. ST2L15]|uniref:glycoside hydrolase family 97 protein n=1 Tax=Mangrovimonas sp. ST2L15 TaxID=1645916 RepID=UPI000A43A2F3|nr:glycoside hydrolase family 97 protein [Mangrovimonas sp. ST2L15]